MTVCCHWNQWKSVQSVQSLSRVQLFATPWTAHARPLYPSPTPRVHPSDASNHLILCCPLLLLPSIFPSIRIFSNESALHIRWPKYWSFSFTSVLPMNIQDWFPLGWTGWISLQSKGVSRIFSNTTVQKHQFFGTQLSFFFFLIFKLYIIVLVLPNIKVNPPQVYMCSPSWTLLPPPSPFQKHLTVGWIQEVFNKYPLNKCIDKWAPADSPHPHPRTPK